MFTGCIHLSHEYDLKLKTFKEIWCLIDLMLMYRPLVTHHFLHKISAVAAADHRSLVAFSLLFLKCFFRVGS